MQTILVSGGAGCIGSNTCLRLSEADFRRVMFDNLGLTDIIQAAWRWHQAESARAPS